MRAIWQNELVGDAQYLGLTFGGTVIFTTSGTFEKADYPGLRALRIKCQGPGGGGGGVASAAGRYAGAGGGGVYAEAMVLAADLDPSETVTVPPGGAGGAAGDNSGTSGNPCSFGSHVSANGGGGGGPGVTTSTDGRYGGAGGNGGLTGVGDLVIPGGAGESMSQGPASGANPLGGASQLGRPRVQQRTTSGSNGQDGAGYGAGGNAGFNVTASGTRSGGDGAPAIVIVELFY